MWSPLLGLSIQLALKEPVAWQVQKLISRIFKGREAAHAPPGRLPSRPARPHIRGLQHVGAQHLQLLLQQQLLYSKSEDNICYLFCFVFVQAFCRCQFIHNKVNAFLLTPQSTHSPQHAYWQTRARTCTHTQIHTYTHCFSLARVESTHYACV